MSEITKNDLNKLTVDDWDDVNSYNNNNNIEQDDDNDGELVGTYMKLPTARLEHKIDMIIRKILEEIK